MKNKRFDGLTQRSRTNLSDIFEAFGQGDTSITRRFVGLGLGLAIAKAAVEAIGERITADSDGAGQGAVFSGRLPVAEVAAAQSF